MTNSWKMISIFRHGINNDNIGPIAKASFEEVMNILTQAAVFGEKDNMKGVSSNILECHAYRADSLSISSDERERSAAGRSGPIQT